MSTNEGKRMAGDYEIIHALHIGDREIVLGENPAGVGDERYMCAVCQKNELLASYTEVMVSDDYPELVKLFGERVAEQAEKTRIELNGPKLQGIAYNDIISDTACIGRRTYLDLHQNFKFARQRKGLTQKQVAEIIHVDETIYAHYESGCRAPNAKTWVALCDVLAIPVFPAQIEIVYPEGLLDDFDKCITDNGQPTEELRENNSRFMAINNFLNRICEIRAEAMDITDLPIDEENMLFGGPITIMDVSLDIRAEKLIEKAIKCMAELMSKNQNLFSNK